jgi:hypothetical protein
MRLRAFRRELARVFTKSKVREFRGYQHTARELEVQFHRLNDELPALNAAALKAGESQDPKQLADVLRAMAANHAASSLILARWADTCESASKILAR